MELIKPKYNYGDKIFRIKYINKKGNIIDCKQCNGIGDIQVYNNQLSCPSCNGIGKYRTEYKVYSIDEDTYIITGIRLNEETQEIEYYLSQLVADELFEESYEEMIVKVTEDTLFLSKENALIECNRRNNIK